MNTILRLFVAIATGAFCALTGLLFEIIGGVLAWQVFRGVQGIFFAMVVGGLTASVIRRSSDWPASSVAGAVGAMVAAYLTIASGEMIEPGSFDWAIEGGLYGAQIGVPLGALLGPLGLVHTNRKSRMSELGEP